MSPMLQKSYESYVFSRSDWISSFCKKVAKVVIDNIKKCFENRSKMGSTSELFQKPVSRLLSAGSRDDFGSHLGFPKRRFLDSCSLPRMLRFPLRFFSSFQHAGAPHFFVFAVSATSAPMPCDPQNPMFFMIFDVCFSSGGVSR